MRDRAVGARLGALAATLVVGLLLAACQSLDTEGALGLGATPDGASTATPKSSQTIGKGPAKVSLLLPLSAEGSIGETGRKMRDGAELAVNDLGTDLITLTIEDTAGNGDRARSLAVHAMTSGAKVVIGPSEAQAVRHIASMRGKGPPVLALAENFSGSPGVYSVLLTEADSAAAGAAAIAAKGSRKFVLFVSEGPGAQSIEKRVANSLSIYGANLTATLRYSPSIIDKVVADMQALVESPDVIIVASGDADPAILGARLRTKGYLRNGVALIGTNRWLGPSLGDPALQGAYVATLGTVETGPFAARFEQKFSYAADLSVAYSYDMVALSSGLVSALGPEGINREVLEKKSGFRGSTGVFRFRADGSNERSMQLYRIQKGTLKQVAASISGF